MNSFHIPHDALPVTPENAYWRSIADYNQIVSKLYFFLNPLDWRPIDAAHATGWHKQGVRDIRKRYVDCQDSYPWVAFDRIYDSRYEHFKSSYRSTILPTIQNGPRALVRLNYVGRLIRRYVLQRDHRARRFAELTLPIPAPAVYAQRQMQAAWHLYAKVLAHLDEQAQATSPNRREYLAIRLRKISLELSDANTLLSGSLSAWIASGSLREVLKVEKAWLPLPLSEPFDFNMWQWTDPPTPDKVGEMRAKVDYFWQCLYDFHEAEKPPTTERAGLMLGTEKVLAQTPRQLSLRQVALLYIYQGAVIPTSADAIARAHGHTSGKRLYELYNKLAHGTANRTGVEGRALFPMLADISAVIPHLTGSARQQAESELRTLEARK